MQCWTYCWLCGQGRWTQNPRAHKTSLRGYISNILILSDFIGAYASSKMSPHSIMVLARHYADTVECNINYNMVLMLAKEKVCKVRLPRSPGRGTLSSITLTFWIWRWYSNFQFRKQNFENFDALMKTLNHNDRSGKGLLSEGEVKRVCKAVGLPIHHDLLTALISKFPKTEGMVDHVKFIEDLKSTEKLGRFF